MDVPAKDVPGGRFFATIDDPPGNVFIMRIAPRRIVATGRYEPGLCQNINDSSWWNIEASRFVRLIREDEHDQRLFSL
jgi:hypothetical protein